jgi:hypothetical protein
MGTVGCQRIQSSIHSKLTNGESIDLLTYLILDVMLRIVLAHLLELTAKKSSINTGYLGT